MGFESIVGENLLCSGAASIDLANSAHVDPNDNSRSYAMWVMNDPRLPAPKSWFFLLPDVGLAIELWDGVAISWDGREVRHCTAVQECDARASLMSLFFAVPRFVQKDQKHKQEMKTAITLRNQLRDLYPPLVVGDVVWVMWNPSMNAYGQPYNKKEERCRRIALVTNLDETGIELGWIPNSRSKKCKEYSFMPKSFYPNVVVRAGATDPLMFTSRMCDASIKGKFVKVYCLKRDEVIFGECIEVMLECEDACVVVASDGNVVHIPLIGCMNPPMCETKLEV